MKQVTQRLRDGTIEVLDVPSPAVTPETVLIAVRASLLSAGTERTKIEAGRKSLIGKARSRPDQVAQVIEKAQRDGLKETLHAVRTRLGQPSALGYSAAGVVLAVGERVSGISVGDRVACGGGDYAVHAEIVCVPGNLCVPLPDGVTFGEGAFATVGAIAMHGVRQADVSLGERVAVVGLGLVGQLTGLLLRAGGCTVVGVDLDPGALDTAASSGAADLTFLPSDLEREPLPAGAGGCDAVLLTAATSSSDPVALAARLCRDRGRVVAVGDVGLHLERSAFYDKELDLRLSRSYGPGRYDREYEERGLDYPVGYVRWTERRNMEAFVHLVGDGRMPVGGLITERVPVEEAATAYERLITKATSPFGLLLTYGDDAPPAPQPGGPGARPAAPVTEPTGVSVIGTGSFSQRVLIPGLVAAGFVPVTAASARGLSARGAMEQFGFRRVGTPEEVTAGDEAGLVAIATRHATHAAIAAQVLRTGRAVFVEKPPCLTMDDLTDLRSARAEHGALLAVGFNRRHAPLAIEMQRHIAAPGRPVEVLIRVAAGRLPEDSWLLDPADGGGRLLGEGCHFVDLACWLVGALPALVTATVRPPSGAGFAAAQRFSITLDFEDGSLATILYGSEGATSQAKEYVELHGGGRSALLEDFRSLMLRDGRRRRRSGGRGQDKGHRAQLRVLHDVVVAGAAPGTPDPLDTMAVTLRAMESALHGTALRVKPPEG